MEGLKPLQINEDSASISTHSGDETVLKVIKALLIHSYSYSKKSDNVAILHSGDEELIIHPDTWEVCKKFVEGLPSIKAPVLSFS